jgi:hypothetical protein
MGQEGCSPAQALGSSCLLARAHQDGHLNSPTVHRQFAGFVLARLSHNVPRDPAYIYILSATTIICRFRGQCINRRLCVRLKRRTNHPFFTPHCFWWCRSHEGATQCNYYHFHLLSFNSQQPQIRVHLIYPNLGRSSVVVGFSLLFLGTMRTVIYVFEV